MKQGWEIKKLGEVCEVITKGTTPTSLGFKFTDEGVNFIKVESLTESGQIIPNKVAYISEECHESLKRSQLKENDILFSIAGALGRIGIVNKAIVPANTNQALAIVRLAKNSGISVSFLAKYFTSNIISAEIEKLKGGAAQQNLSLGQLNNLPIPLPPLPEQQRILAILNEAFAAIAKAKLNAEQNLKNSKELFESYLQGVFENKGEDWEEKTLGEVCEFRNGAAHEQHIDEDGKYILVNSKHISSDGEKGKRTNSALSPLYIGDIAFVMSDVPNGKALAKCFLVDKNDTYTLNQRIGAIRSKVFDNEFLVYQFNRNKYLLSFNNGENQTNLRKNDILNCPLYLPKMEEQKSNVQKLDALSAETKRLEIIYQQKINDLEELKKSVLQKAFSGELKTATAVV